MSSDHPLTRSKAAILLLLLRDFSEHGAYVPIRRLSSTTRQESRSGSFLLAGVKKLATALSVELVNNGDFF